MVQWGANTVHTFDTASSSSGAPAGAAATTAPAGGGFSFGAPTAAAASTAMSPAPTFGGGLFGSSGTAAATKPMAPATTPLFSATYFTGGGLLGGGSATAPGSLGFGQAPSSGIFGSTMTPAASAPFPGFGGGGFLGSAGSTSGGLFGTSGGFGGGAPSQPPALQPFQQPQTQTPVAMSIPAQAALQAHRNAEARQEEARVIAALTSVHQAYAGTALAHDSGIEDPFQALPYGTSTSSSSSNSAPFTLIYYTDASPELRQQQWLQGMVAGGQQPIRVRPVVPPRPPQASSRDWNVAVARNPDPSMYMPSALVGAAALQSRLSYQQESSTSLEAQFGLVRETLDTLARQSQLVRMRADKIAARRSSQQSRLLDLLRKVELVRCFRQPLQPGEVQALERLGTLNRELDRSVRPAVSELQDRAREQLLSRSSSGGTSTSTTILDYCSATPQQRQEWEVTLMARHGPSITRLQQALDRPSRELALLQQRIDRAPPAPVPVPPLAVLRR